MFRVGFNATSSPVSNLLTLVAGGSHFSDKMFSGCSSKLSIISTAPFLLHHRLSTLHFTHHHSLTHPLPLHLPQFRSNSPFLIKSSQRFHSQSTLRVNNHVPAAATDAYIVTSSHPWPEWLELVEFISSSGCFDIKREIRDEFVQNESLSMEFVDAARSCLGFALDRPDILGLLPKDDIQVLINDGTPFLFKSAIETEKRMRSFLQGEESSEATTVDLMKYILSYASNPIIYPERNIKEATELSARNLLREMANFDGRVEPLSMPAKENFNGTGEDEQTPRNHGPNITMKRGDWICQKCSFMNFAKNNKCLECEESRPQRQLTGSEWDCPQCNFYNYGKNTVCLKCECRRPGEVPFPLPNGQVKTPPYTPFVPLPTDTFAKNPENTTKKSDLKTTVSGGNSVKSVTKVENQIKDDAEEEKSERWFKKVAELHDVTDLTTAISDDDFPEIMPMRKGENRFVVSKKKDRSLTSSTYKRQQAMEQGSNINFVPFVPFPPDYFAKKDTISTSSDVSQENSSESTNEKSSVQETRNPYGGRQTQDYFAKKDTNSTSTDMSHENSSKATNDTNLVQETQNPNVRNGWEGKSLEGSAVKETDPLDMSEEAKAERWFRRVAQIKDISELSQIPDEDFPSIMPMRKGVNRFVVSKRKTPLERRLTTPQYKKNLQTMSSEPMKKEDDGSS